MIKKFSILVVIMLVIVSCGPDHPKHYMTFAGKIKNNKDSVITLRGYQLTKNIQVNSDGTFKDSLIVKKTGNHALFLGKDRVYIYLANGYDLFLHGDANKFEQGMAYDGIGAGTNNFINAQFDFSRSFGDPAKFFELEKDAYYGKLNTIEKGIDSIEKLYPDVDTTVLSQSRKFNTQFLKNMKDERVYNLQHKRYLELEAKKNRIAKGQPSPEFKGYLNYKGGKSDLADFRGKYVYIDLWATWCKPCIAQFPALKKLEKDYRNKSIVFMSISTDDDKTARSWEKARKVWREGVQKFKLKGVQLFAGEKQFTTDYLVGTIPRFILLDPQGKIVDNDAPRPGDPKLIKLFNELGI
jgi:thiol-disulfide isomerase/thioredoxin